MNTYIVAAKRTPIGKFGGVLAHLSPVDLGAHVMKAVLDESQIPADALDLYIFGNVLRAGHGQLLPRQAALKAGIPPSVDGFAIDMVCSSGMMSLMQGHALIKAQEANLVLVGGMESMSQTGFFLSQKARWGYKYAPTGETLTDLLAFDGLTDPTTKEIMGNQAERVAEAHGISRAEIDQCAAWSHERANQATLAGHFAAEIAPIEVQQKNEILKISTDEGIRPDVSFEGLSGLRPAFTADGVLTAGNASQISDGASALLLASEAAVAQYGLTPLAKITGSAVAALETWRFPEAPVPAVQKLMQKLGTAVSDFDLIENNEAFALNNVLFHKMLGISYEKLNVHGGAVALGHPIGASGARIITTLVHALHTHNKSMGLAAICHGTGGGTAVAIERV